MTLFDPMPVRPDRWLAPATRVDVAVSALTVPAPADLHGLTALFVSDVHLRRVMDAGRLTGLMAAQHADIILLGGDYADTRNEALRLFRAFRALKAPLGIFAVAGNNDLEAFGSHAALADALSICGAELLVNRSTKAGNLWIGGADDLKYGRPEFSRIFPREAPPERRVLLSHYPLRSGLEEAHPALMLSGHTHGGQFNLLGLTPYSVGFERIGKNCHPPALVSGARPFGASTLLVSKGIGGSRIPLRIGVRPEIHRIAFRADFEIVKSSVENFD